MKQYDYGLCIARLQPLHFGHVSLVNRMIEECNHPILAIGSAQESRTYGNPFTYRERLKMVEAYPWKKKLIVLPLKDIFNLAGWAKYSIDIVERKINNKVRIYYCGNDQDGVLFAQLGLKVAMSDRNIGTYKGLSASKIRQMILNGDNDWPQYVPAMNHALIKRVYKIKERK